MTQNNTVTPEIQAELDAVEERTLTIEVLTFPTTKRKVEIHSNENGPVLLVVNPKAKKSANLGSFDSMDLGFHKNYANAIGSWGRFNDYAHPLNKQVEGDYLLLRTEAPIFKEKGAWTVDEFTAESYLGHVSVMYDPLPLQESDGLFIPQPTIENFPFRWAVLGVQEDTTNFYLKKAKSPLGQSRKLLAYRAILAGRMVKVVVAPHREYLEKLMSSWTEEDDDKARKLRADAIKGASIKRGMRRKVYKAFRDDDVAVAGEVVDGNLVDVSGPEPQVTIAGFTMKKKGGGEIDMASLPAGKYDVFDQHGRHPVANSVDWDPTGLTKYGMKAWQIYSDQKCSVEVR